MVVSSLALDLGVVKLFVVFTMKGKHMVKEPRISREVTRDMNDMDQSLASII